MRENTPPHNPEFEDFTENDDEFEIIAIDNDEPPLSPEEPGMDEDYDNGEDDELQEITLAELLNYAGSAPTDDATLVFEKHNGPVFSCDLHPNLPLAVTGGEDDVAHIWQQSDGTVLKTITDHRDTIISAVFSFDGLYLATGDMAGTIMVNKIEVDSSNDNKVSFQQVWQYSMGDMTLMFWHRGAHVLIAASDSGEIYIWRIPSGECKVLPGHSQRCEAADLTSDGKKLFAGYYDGTLKLWDIKKASVMWVVNSEQPFGHTNAVVAVACDNESPLYVSGGEDQKVVFCTDNGAVGCVDVGSDVECVAFSPSEEFHVLACGTLTGEIFILDYIKYIIRTKCEMQNDIIVRLKWISAYTLLALDGGGMVLGFDARTGASKFVLSGHRSEIYEMSYDAKESMLLTASEDKSARIFKVPDLGN